MSTEQSLKPLTDVVIVRPAVEKHEILALIRDKKTGSGVVMHAGPDVTDATVGKVVHFGDFVGQELRWAGEDLLVMREEHIIGVEDE